MADAPQQMDLMQAALAARGGKATLQPTESKHVTRGGDPVLVNTGKSGHLNPNYYVQVVPGTRWP